MKYDSTANKGISWYLVSNIVFVAVGTTLFVGLILIHVT